MKEFGLTLLLLLTAVGAADETRPTVVVVVGAEGAKEYAEPFSEWAGRWQAAARQGQADFTAIGLATDADKTDHDHLEQRLAALHVPSTEVVWLVLIGHGTYDGKTARFNLRGPDVTPAELAGWLKPIERPLAIIDCTSSSGPFLNGLSGKDRVVVTAARSGSEFNYTRFGDYMSSAITDSKADLDKDEQTSLLEAFLFASSAVREFYAGEGRLASEHSLLDDNGDGLGTPADWFQGLRATKRAKDGATLDGTLAGQMVLVRSQREERLPPAVRARRDQLERKLAECRQSKSTLSEQEYLAQIEPLLLELARLYEQAETRP